MSQTDYPQLKTKLMRQLQLFQEIYHVTLSLAALCADEMPDQYQLDDLLVKRQQLIDKSTEVQQLPVETCDEVEIDTLHVQAIQLEIYSVLEKSATLDKTVRTDLQRKRDIVKNELSRLQSGKKAGAAYANTAPQSEGFFLDSRKN